MPKKVKTHSTHDPVAYERARKVEHDFYHSKAWLSVRRIVLNRDVVCKRCMAGLTTVVDHILERHTHPQFELALFNLQGLCAPCHNKKHGKRN